MTIQTNLYPQISNIKLLISNIVILCFICISSTATLAQPKIDLQWTNQRSNLNASLRGLDAASDSSVIVSGSGGQYAITTDDGSTWQPGKVPGADSLDFRDVHMFDSQNIVLMSAGSGTKSRIYVTSDGGNTWRQTYEMPHEAGFLCAMEFRDSQNGIAFSDPVRGKFRVIVTADGGNTWREIDPSGMPEAIDGEYAFAASGTCLAVWGERQAWIASGGAAARVFCSDNSGKSWSVSETAMHSGAPSQGIFSLAFRGAMTGIATGGDYSQPLASGGNVLRTTDGGISWQPAANAAAVGYRSCVRYLAHSSGGIWLAVGSDGCSYSADDGNTWQNFGEQGYHTLDVSGVHAWAAGADGRVAKLKISPSNE